MTKKTKTPHTIDCHYLLPQFAAAYLMVEPDRALFVENNTAQAVPRLLQALQEADLRPDQVEYLIVTHVHLDHAGGTSKLLQTCPNATVLAHPRAAPHLIDPSHLVASVKRVYGEPVFNDLYGELTPIDASRVRIMQNGEKLLFGSRELTFIHTRGHANHHFCILDSGSNGIFTGDAFGLAYPALQKNGLFIFPSTSPTDFDPVEARLSVQKILATGAQQAFLTHFGILSDLEQAAAQLHSHLDFSEKLLELAVHCSESDADLDAFCRSKLEPYFQHLLAKQGLEFGWDLVKMDLDLNAAGIAHIARKRRKKNSTQ